jgi:hypothetical protein
MAKARIVSKETLWEEFTQRRLSAPDAREAWEAGWRAKGAYLRGVCEESFAVCVSTDDLLQALLDKNHNQKAELAKLHKHRARPIQGAKETPDPMLRTVYAALLEVLSGQPPATLEAVAMRLADHLGEPYPYHRLTSVEVIVLCDEPLCCQVKGHEGPHDDLPF